MASNIDASKVIHRAGSLNYGVLRHRIDGELPLPVFTAVGLNGAAVWGDNGAGGVFTPTGATTATYRPPNKTQSVLITLTDNDGTINRTLTTFATVPMQPQVGFEPKLATEKKTMYARDRTRYARKEGSPEIVYPFTWLNRERTDFEEFRDFYLFHELLDFYCVDTEGNLLSKVWFESELSWQVAGANRFNFAAVMRGIYTGAAAV